MAKVLPFRKAAQKARNISAHDALQMIKALAQDSRCVFVVPHAKHRQFSRRVSRRLIMTCLRKGRITEGPFMNIHGNWQVNVSRHAAGEDVTCVVAIEWDRQLIVVTVF